MTRSRTFLRSLPFVVLMFMLLGVLLVLGMMEADAAPPTAPLLGITPTPTSTHTPTPTSTHTPTPTNSPEGPTVEW